MYCKFFFIPFFCCVIFIGLHFFCNFLFHEAFTSASICHILYRLSYCTTSTDYCIFDTVWFMLPLLLTITDHILNIFYNVWFMLPLLLTIMLLFRFSVYDTFFAIIYSVCC